MEPQKNNEKTVVLQDEGLRKLKGFVQIPKAVLLCKEISYGAKLAYSILLVYAWQDEFCFPAQESLANDLGCSVRQARRFLVELKVYKFISWQQTGLNKPNVYYLLPLPVLQKITGSTEALRNPDGTNMSHPDRTNMSAPEKTNMSGQDKTHMSAYKYSYTHKQNNVNVSKEGKGKGSSEEPKTDLHKLPALEQDKAETELIAKDILHQLGDRQSLPFYYLVASRVPRTEIFAALSSIKQGGATSPPKVFSNRMKAYAAERADTRTTLLHSTMQEMRGKMTLH
jgi:hypothetical protein